MATSRFRAQSRSHHGFGATTASFNLALQLGSPCVSHALSPSLPSSLHLPPCVQRKNNLRLCVSQVMVSKTKFAWEEFTRARLSSSTICRHYLFAAESSLLPPRRASPLSGSHLLVLCDGVGNVPWDTPWGNIPRDNINSIELPMRCPTV